MKKPFNFIIIAIAAAALLPLAACNKTTSAPSGGVTPTATPVGPVVKITPNDVYLGAKLATTAAYTFGITSTAERQFVATRSEAAAQGLRTLATGQNFTAEDVTNTIRAFGGSDLPPGYQLLASGIGSYWGTIYNQLHLDPAKAPAYLEALARGVEDGSAPFLAK